MPPTHGYMNTPSLSPATVQNGPHGYTATSSLSPTTIQNVPKLLGTHSPATVSNNIMHVPTDKVLIESLKEMPSECPYTATNEFGYDLAKEQCETVAHEQVYVPSNEMNMFPPNVTVYVATYPNTPYNQYYGYFAPVSPNHCQAPVMMYGPPPNSPVYYVSPTTTASTSPVSFIDPVSNQNDCEQFDEPNTTGCHSNQPAVAHEQAINHTLAPMYKPSTAQNLSHPSDMATVWHNHFDQEFGQFDDLWELIPCMEGKENDMEHYVHKDTAKIRFLCEKCGPGRAWTSMQGKVKFWFRYDTQQGKGFVYFQLFGQSCRACQSMQNALWYPDEIVKVINNIYSKVGEVYYNYAPSVPRIERRMGRPRGQHNSDLCGACRAGICK